MTEDEENLTIEPLRLNRKPKPVKVSLTQRNGTSYIHLPKHLVKELGLFRNQELVIEKVHSNPMLWELKIRPAARHE